jgi:hypothetical protein
MFTKFGKGLAPMAQATFIMALCTRRVVKRFGSHPEWGKLMLWCMPMKTPRARKKFATEKWHGNKLVRGFIIERECDAFDYHYPVLQLTCLGKGRWRCSVTSGYERDARAWLQFNCAAPK